MPRKSRSGGPWFGRGSSPNRTTKKSRAPAYFTFRPRQAPRPARCIRRRLPRTRPRYPAPPTSSGGPRSITIAVGGFLRRRMRVLLVEDDKTIADFVAKGLHEASYAVDVVGRGDEGLSRALAEPYDAAVVDVM